MAVNRAPVRLRNAAIAACTLMLTACSTPPRTDVITAPPPPALTAERQASLSADLAAAERDLAANPKSEEAAIWVARRLGYLGRYRDAIGVLSRAAAEHPASYRVLRHRGHRWITVRRFDLAVDDLSRAWELARRQPDHVEPDGALTPGVPPRSTDHSNILYHWALAHFLCAEYARAEALFARAAELPLTNDDNRVSCAHWRYLSLMRMGRRADAGALLSTITETMDVRENQAYHRLLLRYKGGSPGGIPEERELDDPGFAYGVAAHLLLYGRRDDAEQVLRRTLDRTNPAAFGHFAAEVEWRRLGR